MDGNGIKLYVKNHKSLLKMHTFYCQTISVSNMREMNHKNHKI